MTDLTVIRSILPSDRSANGELKLASIYSSGLPTPTEDAKASSAFSHKTDFTGAYGVLNSSSNTLRVLNFAVVLGCVDFTHLYAYSVPYFPPPPPVI
jgi:hypothetical protein